MAIGLLLTVYEIFSLRPRKLENRHFRRLYSNCRPPSGGTHTRSTAISTYSTYRWKLF